MAGEVSSGWLDQGTNFLKGLSEAYGTYERAKTANDLEYPSYDSYSPARIPGASGGVPGWVWIAGAVGLSVLAWRVSR